MDKIIKDSEEILHIIKDLEEIVRYMWAEENKNWEELDNPGGHIFLAVNNIRNYLEWRKNEQKNKKRTSSRSSRETKEI